MFTNKDLFVVASRYLLVRAIFIAALIFALLILIEQVLPEESSWHSSIETSALGVFGAMMLLTVPYLISELAFRKVFKKTQKAIYSTKA